MKLVSFLRRNAFVLILLVGFLLTDAVISRWDPMSHSLRFYKNDFVKTLLFHNWSRSGPVFFGNSAVTGAYMEDKASVPLVEMGLSYGKITDLQAILEKGLYRPQGQLVVGIDVHTMLDKLTTDYTYEWFKPWYQPYVYYYRDYFRDSAEEWVHYALQGDFVSYQPRWTDKMLYFGKQTPKELEDKWQEYEKRFGWMKIQRDMTENIAALRWVAAYCKERDLPLKVVWMPLNPAYPPPAYVKPLREAVDALLKADNIPALDLMSAFEPKYFHDLVHLNREEGAPKFTREVDQWLLSFAKSRK